MCHVILAVVISPAKPDEKRLKLSIEAAKMANPTNICLVLPAFEKKKDDYDASELTNANELRGIAAKVACEQLCSIIDPTGPHTMGQMAQPFRCLQRVWRQIAAELIPPPSTAAKAQKKPEKGKMTGLDDLANKFK